MMNTLHGLQGKSNMRNGDDHEVEVGLLGGEERKEASALGDEETLEPPDVE